MHILKKNKVITFLASLVFPGLAHALLGYTFKAITLAGSLLFHILLIYIIYKQQILHYPLTLAHLVMALCTHYFYSVFDALQLFEYKKVPVTKSKRVILAFSLVMGWGMLVIVSYLYVGIAEQVVALYPYIFLLLSIVYLVTHMKSKQWVSLYVGRSSVIVCLIFFLIVGVSYPILWTQLHINILIIVFVSLLVFEMSILYTLKRSKRKIANNLRFDWIAIIAMVAFVMMFMLVPKYGHLPSELLKSFHGSNRIVIDYDMNFTKKQTNQPILITTGEQHNKLSIKHANGTVKVNAYQGEYIKVESVRYDSPDEQFQTLIEETNRVDVTMSENELLIQTVLVQHDAQLSMMDITVYLPFNIAMKELDINVENGTVKLENIKQFDLITLNGNQTHMHVIDSSGDIQVKVKDGTTFVLNQHGRVTVHSRKGNIMLEDILMAIDAETLNGSILIRMDAFYSTIQAHASAGSVQISLPEIVTYNLNAASSFGRIIVDDLYYIDEVAFTSSDTKKNINVFADQNIVID